jgi:DNA-binding CsgD family transcriptional regulator
MALDDRIRAAPGGVVETSTDGRVLDVDETAAATLESTTEALCGSSIHEAFPQSAAGTLREAFDGGAVADCSFEEYYPRVDRWLAVEIHVGETVLVYVRDRTDRMAEKERVDELEQRLGRVREVNSVVATVLRRVVDAPDRTSVGETVCERLGGTGPYQFAWVGERDFPGEELRELAAAGDAPDLRNGIDEALGEGGTLPERAALETGEAQLVGTIAEKGSIPRGVRRAAFGHGVQSCYAVPLAYRGTTYGVVSVYSGREDGFSEQERSVLETLAHVAGFAVRALRQEDLLVADTVTEVTIDVDDRSLPFARAARAADGRLSLDGAVPRGDGAVVCYVTVEDTGEESGATTDGDEDTDGSSGAGLRTALAEHEAVADVRWIQKSENPRLQATLVGETPISTLVAWGTSVATGEFTAESARLVAEAPSHGEVRRVVEAVDETAAETDLVAKTETTRTAETAEAFRSELDERLTDRQRTVLRTAYLSDYFDSPRGSTSKEVAGTLDIAGSTLLYHLRRAQQELVSTYLEADSKMPHRSDP